VSVPGLLDAVFWGWQFLATALALVARDPWLTPQRKVRMAAFTVIGLNESVLFGWQAGAGFCAGILVLLGGDWFRRNGRRVAKQLSEEARALAAGLAERLGETLEPAPEGARA
jgi:hypothetical protein